MGLFVRLDLTQVEGLVSIKSLGNEWFEFDEDALTLTGADTGTRYELGQRVIIEVSRVNTTRGHLTLSLSISQIPAHGGERRAAFRDRPLHLNRGYLAVCSAARLPAI